MKFQKALAALVGFVILAPVGNAANQVPTIQERVMEMAPGTIVEVRLTDKHKVRGRMGDVTEDGFTIQFAEAALVKSRKIVFSQVKSVKEVNARTGAGMHILAGVGIALASLMVLGLILNAAY